MIHVNSRTGHEILTEEEFTRKHPALAAALNAPSPFKEQGEELKRRRQAADLSLREMAKATGVRLADISAMETGRTEPTQAVKTAYQTIGCEACEGECSICPDRDNPGSRYHEAQEARRD